MKEITGKFLGSDGKSKIAYYMYRPEGAVRAVVQVSHGMCEYVERYRDFAAFLCANGIAFCGNDHMGHGQTAGSAGELGYLGQRATERLPQDVHKMTQLIQEEFPAVPCFLFGHSMGSFVARLYMSRYSKDISGAILSGTAGTNPMVQVGLCLAKIIILLRGDHYRSVLLDTISFGNYHKKYKTKRTKYDWLSQDVRVVDDYARNPYNNFLFTAGGFHEMFAMLHRVSGLSWAKTVNRDLPVFLFSGQLDPVGSYGKGVEEVAGYLEEAGVRKVTVKLYAHGRHEMINETNKEEVYADILRWIERQMMAKKEKE